MNAVKKILGLVWMLLAPTIIIFLGMQALDKIKAASEATKSNVTLQWAIILIIFIPICIGLLIFGLYSYKGEYNHLPENSNEL